MAIEINALSGICSRAGWHGDDLKVAIAVAMAESGGKADNYNGSCCYGLFQINIDSWLGKYGSPSGRDSWISYMYDPDKNARFAHGIWSRNNHTFAGQWKAYDNGAYRKYLGKDFPVLHIHDTGASAAVGDAAEGVVSAAKSIPELIKALFDPSTYLRLGKGVLGGVFIILGLASLVFIVANRAVSSSPVRNARRLATA